MICKRPHKTPCKLKEMDNLNQKPITPGLINKKRVAAWFYEQVNSFLNKNHCITVYRSPNTFYQLCCAADTGLEKTWIPTCSWDKYLLKFACPWQVLVCPFNDLVDGWLAWSLAHWASASVKLLAQKENGTAMGRHFFRALRQWCPYTGTFVTLRVLVFPINVWPF